MCAQCASYPGKTCPFCGSVPIGFSNGIGSTFKVNWSSIAPQNVVEEQPKELGRKVVPEGWVVINREDIKVLLYDLGFRGLTDKQTRIVDSWYVDQED